MRWPAGITDAMVLSLGKLWGMLRDEETWTAAVYRVAKSWTWLGGSTTTTRQWTLRKANGKDISRGMKVIYFK